MDDMAENLNYPWDEEKNQSRKPKTTAAARTRGKSTVGESVDQVTPRRDYKHNFFFTVEIRLCLYHYREVITHRQHIYLLCFIRAENGYVLRTLSDYLQIITVLK